MRTHALARLLSWSLLAVAPGCATSREFVYRPSAAAIADVEGYPAARYLVPPERPEAEIRVASLGLTYVQDAPGPSTVPVLQVRVTIEPTGEAALTFDTTQALIDIPGEGAAAPLYVNSDRGGMPVVSVARGQHALVDLYFPVPGSTAYERPPAFSLNWQVQTGTRLVAERTAFLPVEVRPRPASPPVVLFAAGWGPFWWFHPHYPHGHVYVHAPVMVVPPPHRRVVVVRPPPHGPRPPGPPHPPAHR